MQYAITLGICNRICVKLLQPMSGVIHYAQFSEKRSLYINKWLHYSQLYCFTLANLSAILEFIIRFVSNSRDYVRCYSAQFKKKTTSLSQTVFLRSTNTTHTHAHIHDDGIRRNANRCILPKIN